MQAKSLEAKKIKETEQAFDRRRRTSTQNKKNSELEKSSEIFFKE